MERKPVPVRFLDLWLRIPPAVTAFLPAAWYWADEPLRAELQTSIAAMMRRDPALLSSLRPSARVFRARHLGFGAAFVAMIGGAEDDDWMVFPFGRGPEARSALAAWLGRFQS